MNSQKHVAVLLNEAVDALRIKPNGIYVDGTFGRGGHSRLILSKLNSAGHLFAIDRDPEAEKAASEIKDKRFTFIRGCFGSISSLVEPYNIIGHVDGFLLDLGVSSPQLDNADRGFSFMKDGPLDMRMDPEHGKSAAAWLATAEERDIADVIYRYGGEKMSKRIARAIVNDRTATPFVTTKQLADLVARIVPVGLKGKGHHPATRTFQGIRIFINAEMSQEEDALAASKSLLTPGGRLAVITFHSLEDHLVKCFIRDCARGIVPPHGVPVKEEDIARTRTLKIIEKGLIPSPEEIEQNPRSRSAVLHVAEKLGEIL